MALDEGVGNLIGRIYEVADDEERWTSLLQDVRCRLDVGCLFQSISDLRRQDMLRVTTLGQPRNIAGEDEYKAFRYADDPSFQWAGRNPNARFCDTRTFSPTDPEIAADYIRWNREEYIGSTHWLVGYTPPDEDLTFGLSIHPSHYGDPLMDGQVELFKLLFNHMERAIRLTSRPPDFASDEDALLVLDRRGFVRGMSNAASRLLQEADGLSISHDRIIASDLSSCSRLDLITSSAANALFDGGHGGAVSIARPSGRRSLLVTAMPLINRSTPFGGWRSAALVRIIDPDQKPNDRARYRWTKVFGLTAAEARLAAMLISEDGDLRKAAEELAISYHTARVHLRNIMQKTDTHSQSQLARLLSRLG